MVQYTPQQYCVNNVFAINSRFFYTIFDMASTNCKKSLFMRFGPDKMLQSSTGTRNIIFITNCFYVQICLIQALTEIIQSFSQEKLNTYSEKIN